MAESNPPNNLSAKPRRRLLFVITLGEFGGAQRFLFNLVSRLERKAYAIKIVSGGSNHTFLASLNKEGVVVSSLASLKREISPLSDLKALGQIKKIIRAFQPDIIFLLSSKAGFLGALAARQLKSPAKIIYRIGGWTFNDPWPRWKKLLFTALEKLSARWKDIIIVNNQSDLATARKIGLKPRQDIKLIHNGVDAYKMEFFDAVAARQKILKLITEKTGKIPPAKIIIGTIANFYPAKGLDYLLTGANRLKDRADLIFAIIGDGPGKPDLEQKIKAYGLTEKVFLLGQIPDAFKYLPAFTMFVLSSVKEGFPWVLLEAMAAKLPIIATAVGAVPEIIENEKNGIIVPPKNATALANSINDLLGNEFKMREMGLQANQTVLLRFGLEKMVSQIKNLL